MGETAHDEEDENGENGNHKKIWDIHDIYCMIGHVMTEERIKHMNI